MREAVSTEIQAHMARRRLHQQHLAEALGVNQQWVSRRLRGAVPITIDDLEAICHVLNVDPIDLMIGAQKELEPAALDRRTLAKRNFACTDAADFQKVREERRRISGLKLVA